MCFGKESQKYPDDFSVGNALTAAKLFFDNWDQSFAAQLVDDFQLPLARKVRKLSRGQLSAVGVIIGFASRAEITFFDEPYVGLDAVACQIFYDRLIADYGEHPRTVILSSHLINEVANLIEHVVLIDQGRILIDDATEAVLAGASNLVGNAEAVERFTVGREVLRTASLGHVVSTTVLGSSLVLALMYAIGV